LLLAKSCKIPSVGSTTADIRIRTIRESKKYEVFPDFSTKLLMRYIPGTVPREHQIPSQIA